MLNADAVHRRFESFDGEAALATLISNDRGEGMAMSGFSHLPLARPSRQHVRASSRLLLPALQ